MSVKDIVKKESNVDLNSLGIVRFYRGGDWWRAYEFAAYLSVVYTAKKSHELKATKKILGDGEYVSVGMKYLSFDKYFGEVIGKEPLIEEDVITLDLSGMFTNEELTSFYEGFSEWKDCLLLTKKKSKGGENQSSSSISENKTSSLTTKADIKKIIMEYPLANKTPMENTQFINELQKLIGEMG